MRSDVCESTESFCSLLNKSYGPVWLDIEFRDRRFHLLKELQEGVALDNVESISLSNVLRDFNLTAKMKLVVAYTLAQSVWRYYNSDWMGRRWTTESIHFMRVKSAMNHADHLIYACDPCLAVDFSSTDEPVLEYLDGTVIHRYPRMLALGSLLVDIARDRPRDQPRPSGSGNLRKCINDDHVLARMVIKQDVRWPHLQNSMQSEEIKARYKEVTMRCLDREFFSALSRASSHQKPEKTADAASESPDVNVEERRNLIWRQVVAPLGDLLDQLGWRDSLEEIEPMVPIAHTDEVCRFVRDVVELSGSTRKARSGLLSASNDKR